MGNFEVVRASNGEDSLMIKDSLLVKDTARLVPVGIPKGMDPYQFRKCVIAAYAQFVIDGEVTLEGVQQRSLLPAETCRVALQAPETAEALRHRGVNLGRATGLTEQQDLLLQILGDPFDGLNMQQKLRKAGVTGTQYNAWIKQPLFAQHFKSLTEQLHMRSEEAMIQLQRRAGEGDLNSIKFLFEVNGRYNPATQKTLDTVVILGRVLESLSKHVKDPIALTAVANDMRQLALEAGYGDDGLQQQ